MEHVTQMKGRTCPHSSPSLYTDAYSGRTSLSVSGKSPGSVTVTAVGAGGNYFLFHPLTLLSGGYISDEDYMADRVVLDAQTAFNLFGSSDVAGMEVTINGRTFPIAGVVQSDERRPCCREQSLGRYKRFEHVHSHDLYELQRTERHGGTAHRLL